MNPDGSMTRKEFLYLFISRGATKQAKRADQMFPKDKDSFTIEDYHACRLRMDNVKPAPNVGSRGNGWDSRRFGHVLWEERGHD